MRNQAIATAAAVRGPFVAAEKLVDEIIARGDGASTAELTVIRRHLTETHTALNTGASQLASLFSEDVSAFSGGGDKPKDPPSNGSGNS